MSIIMYPNPYLIVLIETCKKIKSNFIQMFVLKAIFNSLTKFSDLALTIYIRQMQQRKKMHQYTNSIQDDMVELQKYILGLANIIIKFKSDDVLKSFLLDSISIYAIFCSSFMTPKRIILSKVNSK
ncbi:unnamed protein product [Paramecium sonneborni]|uniref:Uncharacterized protein n=1 Tax=Paramecium sonneborni TaxID=65129 RepID=A0A8S1M8G2_9CILI|nr:unnamed protein product [Paramecium sonneborni]